MNSLAVVEREAAASNVKVTENELIVSLVDGRVISVPITWYPRLSLGTAEERNHYELMGRGTGYPLASSRRRHIGVRSAQRKPLFRIRGFSSEVA